MAHRLRLFLTLCWAIPALGGCSGIPSVGASFSASDSAWLASRGFWLREADALLHLTQREIFPLSADSMSQVLHQADRVEVRLLQNGRKEYRLHPASTRVVGDRSCELDLFLNGLRFLQRTEDILDLRPDRMIQPYVVTGVEVFTGADAPVGDPDACGAILFWVARLREDDDPPFTGVLQGRVLRVPERTGIAGVPVTVEPGGLRQVTDARGVFDFGDLPATVYRVEAEVPDWGKYETEIPLRSNTEADVLIEIERR